jgi:hypothetical protein
MRSLVGVALLAAITPCVWAQRFGGPAHMNARANFSHSHHFGRSGASHFPVAFLDPFYGDYFSEPPAVPAQPQVVVMQAPAPAEAYAAPAPPAQPLMIELQGDRYVQVSGEKDSSGEMVSRDARAASRESSAGNTPTARAPSALLVFRDGHREEVSAYTIADGVLYASADYYSSGAWNRKIALASLNLPDTIKANQARGISFQLPSAANEVIVGP